MLSPAACCRHRIWRRAVPGLTVDSGAVEESRQDTPLRTDAAEHQTDPVQRRQHEHAEGQQETAMVRLSNTAVNPTTPHHTQTQWGQSD